LKTVFILPARDSGLNATLFCSPFSCNDPQNFFNNQVKAIEESGGHSEDRPNPLFVTTHLSVVLAAGHSDTTAVAGRRYK
jgi:hypothetical protein